MSELDFLFAFAAVLIAGVMCCGRDGRAGWAAMAVYGAMLVAVMAAAGKVAGGSIPSGLGFSVLGHKIGWRMDGLGWFFSMLTAGAAFFASWYAAGEWGRAQPGMKTQHLLLALNVAAMLLLVNAGDLLSLFIGWELVSWAAFAMMAQKGGPAQPAAMRYMIYALAGAMAVLAGIMIVHAVTGSFAYKDFAAAFGAMSSGMKWLLAGLFAAGFGVKMALMPFHLWQAAAYSETPGASSAFLNAVSARMGLFALILVLIKVMGLSALAGLRVPLIGLSAKGLLMWIAAFTMVIPTFIALMQTDARMLLTWHGIGQGGYMLLGVLVGTGLGTAGGLLHVFNYATYQMALFLAVTAVIHRTGTSDLDRLGGLITRMPWTYVTLLMGIIGLAGLPPMNGFVSKWMIYRSLLDSGSAFLLIFAFVGTLGTILSVYKLIHNIFLGRLRPQHEGVREAPWSMVAPMLALGGIGFVTGWFPGLALNLTDIAQAAMGAPELPHGLGGVATARGSLNMIWVVSILLVAIGFGAIVFYFLGNRRYEVNQLNNYAGGHFLSPQVPYQFSHEFYPGLARVIGPWYRGSIVRAEQGIGTLLDVSGDLWRGIYHLAWTPLYLLAATVIALGWAIMGGM